MFNTLPPAPDNDVDLMLPEGEVPDIHGEPQAHTMDDVLQWQLERGQASGQGNVFSLAKMLPLVARRELYRNPEMNAYRHVNFWALYFVLSGRGTHFINGHAWSMARGHIYLLAPNAVHFYRGATNLVVEGIYFGENLFSPEEQAAISELKGAAPLVATPGAPEETGHFLHLTPQRQLDTEGAIISIRGDLRRPEQAYQLSAKYRLWCLIVQLAAWREETPESTRGGKSREIADALQFCEANFSRDLSVEQLADITNFSGSHFTRLFKQEVGMAPAAYLRHLRLQHGQKLLRETLHAVADIAQLCGFTDATGFSRAFQKSFGVSPIAYRKTNKQASKAFRYKKITR
ncbi:AraC family transcriptional regulator [bacterium]|nr:MAG: AraC family transcriptional regulator [bacterium]